MDVALDVNSEWRITLILRGNMVSMCCKSGMIASDLGMVNRNVPVKRLQIWARGVKFDKIVSLRVNPRKNSLDHFCLHKKKEGETILTEAEDTGE
jgi:hypothetical protein